MRRGLRSGAELHRWQERGISRLLDRLRAKTVRVAFSGAAVRLADLVWRTENGRLETHVDLPCCILFPTAVGVLIASIQEQTSTDSRHQIHLPTHLALVLDPYPLPDRCGSVEVLRQLSGSTLV